MKVSGKCCNAIRSIFSIANVLLFAAPVLAQTNTFPASGNVGIGTTSPTQPLHIKSGASGNSSILLDATTSNGWGAIVNYSSKTSGGASTLWNTGTGILDALNSWCLYDTTDAKAALVATTAGNVGVGTSSPAAKLDVSGGGGAFGVVMHVSGTTTLSPSWAASDVAVNATASPNSNALSFQVAGSIRSAATGTHNLIAGFSTAWAPSDGGATITNAVAHDIATFPAFPHIVNAYGLRVASPTGATNNYSAVFTGGNVGIGTTSPTATLDVAGNVNVSGNIAAKYQDIAEWVPSDGALPSGTVVVLNTERPNHVEQSSNPYDTKVAGVVSDRPGMILGEESADKSRVATTGRVRVKVDATKHPVKVGDLLVTSDTPGFAMYSEPVKLGGIEMHRPGTIVGKALEPLLNGRGEILVLLSLQ